MNRYISLLLIAVLYFSLEPASSYATIVGGDVWGEWNPNGNNYYVYTDLHIPPDSTLIIDPGCRIIFLGNYKLSVDSSSTLTAIGTESDSIIFTPEDTVNGWGGIRFYKASNNSRLSYCRIEWVRTYNAGAGISCDQSSPEISNNTITNNSAGGNGGGIFCRYSNPIITNNTISNNFVSTVSSGGGGICCMYSCPIIKDNLISNNSVYRFGNSNGGGFYCFHSVGIIENNEIVGNSAKHGGGIYCFYSNPTIGKNNIRSNIARYGGGIYCLNSGPTIRENSINNNNVYKCGGAIFCKSSHPIMTKNVINNNSADYFGGGIFNYFSSPELINNTISGNCADSSGGGIYCYHHSVPVVVNTIFWADSASSLEEIYLGNYSSITITYSDIDGSWFGEGNIDSDPMFVDPENGNFHIQWGSPCIDAGDPDSPPDSDGTTADIGAFSYYQNTGINDDNIISQDYKLLQNYPNPFNSMTKISYSLPRRGKVFLNIYNLMGQRVATLVKDYQQMGVHSVSWDASDYSSGTYFCKLTAGKKVFTNRMTLLK